MLYARHGNSPSCNILQRCALQKASGRLSFRLLSNRLDAHSGTSTAMPSSIPLRRSWDGAYLLRRQATSSNWGCAVCSSVPSPFHLRPPALVVYSHSRSSRAPVLASQCPCDVGTGHTSVSVLGHEPVVIKTSLQDTPSKLIAHRNAPLKYNI